MQSKMAVTGGVSPVVAVLGGLVVGFVVACVVVCIIDLPKLKKQKNGSAQTQQGDDPQSEPNKDSSES